MSRNRGPWMAKEFETREIKYANSIILSTNLNYKIIKTLKMFKIL